MSPETTPQPAAKTFWDYRELFKGRIRRFYQVGIGEESGSYETRPATTPLNEKLIQLIWANQMFVADGLRLADGRPLRVLDPGRWNGSAGPDFQGAQLMIGFDVIGGDVEIHTDASQWRAHGHERDLDYNRTVLHVVFRIDDDRTDDRLHNGDVLPRFEIEPYLFPDLETIRRSLSPDDFAYDRPSTVGRCYDVMTSAETPLLLDFLDRAGDERLAAKIGRLEEQAAQADAEQVFYQALMTSLGAGAGKTLYYLLAKRAPAAELLAEVQDLEGAERREAIEAILLWVANLNPTPEELAEAPEESRAYAERLEKLWTRFEPFWADRVIPPTRRWYRGIRPVNFPTRRLAAMAGLLARENVRVPGAPADSALRSDGRTSNGSSGASPEGGARGVADESSPAAAATSASAPGRSSGSSPGPALLHALASRVRAGADSLHDARPRKRGAHPIIRDLTEWFLYDPPGNFWQTHYSFKARPAGRNMKLIGEGAARSLVFNAALPALGLWARQTNDDRLEQAVRRLYGIFPPLQRNHVTEFMTRRLFGDDSEAAKLINTERRHQGLFQVFYGCCRSEPRHCDACYYLEGLGSTWDSLSKPER